MSEAKPRIVAVDYGKARVGLAVSDPLQWFAQPIGTYRPNEALQRLQRFCAEHDVAAILIGWPLTLDGEEGVATERVQSYIDRIQKAVPGIAVLKQDERYSSQCAKEAIRAAGARRKARRDKARVDAAAASIILQEYLDEQK